MVVAIGIDAGSTALKIVGIDENKKIVFSFTEDTEPEIEKQVDSLLNGISDKYNISKAKIVATGYGSNLIKISHKKVTEITCHATGLYQYFKHGGTGIDIGGQDNKVILIADRGNVIDFVMNDKCASGTGRFLENTAWRLKIPVNKMGEIALSTEKEVPISSTCAVFAESEVISMLARGKKLEEVIRGLHRAMVKRIVSMIYSIGLNSPVMVSGGVVKNKAVVKMLEEEIGEKILIPENPQIIGAYGAALLGL